MSLHTPVLCLLGFRLFDHGLSFASLNFFVFSHLFLGVYTPDQPPGLDVPFLLLLQLAELVHLPLGLILRPDVVAPSVHFDGLFGGLYAAANNRQSHSSRLYVAYIIIQYVFTVVRRYTDKMLAKVKHRDMSGAHVRSGDRAYLPASKGFGDVTRDRLLGLKKGCVIKGDDGKLRAFGGDVVQSVVNKESGMDGSGTQVPLPTDVKVVGPYVLSKFGVGEAEHTALFSKFNALDPIVREEKAAFFEEHKDDDKALGEFVTGLMDILQTDDVYIATHAQQVLADVPDDIRAMMTSNLATAIESDTRKQLIGKFHTIQNDRIQVEGFKQQLFATLLDNTTYARLEMTRCLLRQQGATAASADERVQNFIQTASQATIDKFVTEWRHLKYFRNSAKKFAMRKVLHSLKANEAQAANANPQVANASV